MKITLDTSSHSFRTFFTLSLFLFSFILIGTAAYSAWTDPVGTAPNSNVDAPVNVGSASQTKSGPLGVNGLSNSGNEYVAGYLGVGTQPSGSWRILTYSSTNGIYAQASGSYALYGDNSSGYGVIGNATTNGTGVRGMSISGLGVRGDTSTSYAGYFIASGAGGGLFAQNGSGYYAFLGYPASSWGVYTNGSIYAGSQVRGDAGFCIGGSCISSWSQAGGISSVTTAYCSSNSGGCYATCPSGYYRTGCSFVPNHPYYSSVVPSGSNACFIQGGNSESSASGYAYCAR